MNQMAVKQQIKVGTVMPWKRPGALLLCQLLIIAAAMETRPVEAQDCSNTFQIDLLEQADVDNFQAVYGPCDRVVGSLNINPFNGPITDLSPLTDLVEIGEVISINGTFSDLSGLDNLVSVGQGMTIGGAPITDLSGLHSLTTVGRLEVDSIPTLTSLAGMPNLATVTLLRLDNLPFLPNLNGLPAVVDIEDLSIVNSGLTSLDGAPVMGDLRNLELLGTSLTDVTGLSGSTFGPPTMGPGTTSIDIVSNFDLTSLVGIPVGDKIGSLTISSNGSISSLAGFENLVEVWSLLEVTENDFLADCSALVTVLDDVDDGDPGPGDGMNPADPPDTNGLGSITIVNNGEAVAPDGNCNSIEDILAAGETETCNTVTVAGAATGNEMFEACELLILDPSFNAQNGASVMISSGTNIDFMPGANVEPGATLNATTCGLSLCEPSAGPMPVGCHSCVVQICDVDSSCCDTAWSQACVDQVNSVCGLVCE